VDILLMYILEYTLLCTYLSIHFLCIYFLYTSFAGVFYKLMSVDGPRQAWLREFLDFGVLYSGFHVIAYPIAYPITHQY